MHRSSSCGGRQDRPLSSAEKAELRAELARNPERLGTILAGLDRRLEAVLADRKAWETPAEPKVLVRILSDDFWRNGIKYEKGTIVEFPPLAAEVWQEHGRAEIVKDWRVPCLDGRMKQC